MSRLESRPGEPGWRELERPAPRSVTVAGAEIRAGSRVRLRPARSGDIFDRALGGRAAIVERIEQDEDDRLLLAVTLEDDPARSFGTARQLAHLFFFAPTEVEPAGEAGATATGRGRILVAGIGNVFLADDGFGVQVANALSERELPPQVEVHEFGIRGMDLAYALTSGLDAAILIDAAPRGEPPGTLSVIEPDAGDGECALETHGMDPVRVLGLARALGTPPRRVLIVACEPATHLTGEEDQVVMDLSGAVRGAVEPAVELVHSLVAELLTQTEGESR